MTEENRIIALLEENGRYLKEILEIQKKRQRSSRNEKILHVVSTLLPFILIAIAGWFAWTWINHYMEIMNNNINALKSNFDLLREFLQKLVPDFGAIGDKLQQTWQSVKFWN
jgi:hypothetical protein